MDQVVFDIVKATGAGALGALLRNYSATAATLKYWAKGQWRVDSAAGTWHTYHFTHDEQGARLLRYEEWTIWRNWYGELRLRSADPERPTLVYRSTAIRERGWLVFTLKGEDETWQAILQAPFPGAQLVWGVFVSLDFRGLPFSSVKLLSATRLESPEAERLILNAVELNQDEAAIRLSIKPEARSQAS